MKFNIVYTPGSVRHLSLFLLSLVKHSEATFRIVSNGCTEREVAFLSSLTDAFSTLEFLLFSKDVVHQHPFVLNSLQARENEDYFCFMDSDILATEEFIDFFCDRIGKHSAIFSCHQVCSSVEPLPPEAKGIPGSASETTDGFCLGSTYFAIYDNHALTRFIADTGITFDSMLWKHLRKEHQEVLIGLGLNKLLYDVGKVLNILFQSKGHSIRFVDAPMLHHIGGMSWPGVSRSRVKISASPSVLEIVDLVGTLPADYANTIPQYFSRLIDALWEKASLPELPGDIDEALRVRVTTITKAVIEQYAELGDELQKLWRGSV